MSVECESPRVARTTGDMTDCEGVDMPKGTCTFPDCGRPISARGLCHGHYEQGRQGKELKPLRPRWDNGDECSFAGCSGKPVARTLCSAHYRQLSAGKELRPKRVRQKGCDFPGCDRPHKSKGLCDTHYSQARAGLSLSDILPVRGSRVSKPSYGAAHTRVTTARGPASGYRCVSCGGPAIEWAYQHTGVDEIAGETSGYAGAKSIMAVWSGDPEQYQPMCRSCHIKFDRAAKA